MQRTYTIASYLEFLELHPGPASNLGVYHFEIGDFVHQLDLFVDELVDDSTQIRDVLENLKVGVFGEQEFGEHLVDVGFVGDLFQDLANLLELLRGASVRCQHFF